LRLLQQRPEHHSTFAETRAQVIELARRAEAIERGGG